MAFSLANERKWQTFLDAAIVVWEAKNLGIDEWRLMNQLIGLSDWAKAIPESDQYNPRRMVVHAQAAMTRRMGYKSANAIFSM
jgi:hypothetical protein